MEQYLDIYPLEEYHSPTKKDPSEEDYSPSKIKLPYLLGYSNYLEACEYIKSRDKEANAFKAQVFETRENSKKKYNDFIMCIKDSTSEAKETDGNLQALESLKNEVTSIKSDLKDLKNMNENLTKLILENIRK